GSLTSGRSAVAAVAGDLAGALVDADGVAADVGRRGWDAMSDVAGAGAGKARAVANAGTRAARRLASVATAVLDRSPGGMAASIAADVAGGGGDWGRRRREWPGD